MTVWQQGGGAVHESAAEALRKNPLKYMRELLDQTEKIKAERDGYGNSGQLSHSLIQCIKWQSSP